MATFPVFQSVGPNVDVRLFGEAAETGAKLGQQIPTQLTAGIQGAQEGYKTGVQEAQIQAQTEGVNLENQIRQNQIEQLPVENQIRRDAMVVKDLEAKNALATEDLSLQAQNAELQASIDKNTQASALYKLSSDFMGDLQSDDPQRIAQSVLGNKYLPLFKTKDGQALYQQGLNQVITNPQLPPEIRHQAIVKSALLQNELKGNAAAIRNEDNYQKTVADLYGGETAPIAGKIASALNTTIEDGALRVEPFPHGQYETVTDPTDPTKSFVKLDSSKNWIPTQDFNRATAKTFDLIDPKTGTVAATDVPDSVVKKLGTYQSSAKLRNGYYTQLGAENILNSFSPKTDAAPNAPQIKTFGDEPTAAPAPKKEQKDIFKQTLADTFKVKPETLDSVGVPLSHLEDQVKNFDPAAKDAQARLNEISNTFNLIGRSLADKEYAESPALQSTLGDKQTMEYNSSLDAAADKYAASAYAPQIRALTNSLKVDSPQHLYYFTVKKPVVEASLSDFISNLKQSYAASNTKTIRKQRALSNTLSILSNIRNG